MNQKISQRDQINEHIISHSLVLFPDGQELIIKDVAISQLDSFCDKPLKQFILHELKLSPLAEVESSWKIMRQLEIIDHEPASDVGHMRLYPKGKIVFDLLSSWAEQLAIEKLQCYQIDSPILYRWDDPEIRAQGESFHERHYRVLGPDDEKGEMILRFAGDFGLFKMMKDAQLSWRSMPVRVYEFSKSFRYEQHGELSGIKRLRAFHMPDIHSFCESLDQGWQEFQDLFIAYNDLAQSVHLSYAVVFRVVQSFYDQNKMRFIELLRQIQRPAWIEVISEMKHYWVVKSEFQFLDRQGDCIQMSSVQLDIKDGENYHINYVNKDGQKLPCFICHSSIGSIERWMYSIFENALSIKPAQLPYWLAPVQLRILPVSADHLEFCEGIGLSQVRYDIDDRNESLAKRIYQAESEWIPYVLIVGDKEKSSGKVSIRMRGNKNSRVLSLFELQQELQQIQASHPFKEMCLPRKYSKRFSF